jgi:hypothetical protein
LFKERNVHARALIFARSNFRVRQKPTRFGWNAHNSAAFPNTKRVLQWINASTALAATHSALTGVSFDIEPGASVPGSYQAYADLLVAVRAKLNTAPPASRLQLSIAGSWGYELVNVSCGTAGTNVSMLDCAVSLVDMYILMNYRNNANGCFCRPPPQRNPARLKCPADGSPIAANCTGPASADGMIGKATSAAMAVKWHASGRCKLSLGVETSCFPASDAADKRYEWVMTFSLCRTLACLTAWCVWERVRNSSRVTHTHTHARTHTHTRTHAHTHTHTHTHTLTHSHTRTHALTHTHTHTHTHTTRTHTHTHTHTHHLLRQTEWPAHDV